MRPSVRLLVGGTCAATLLGCGPPAESPPIAVASTPTIAVGPTVAPGSVRGVLQKPAVVGGHGMLVMFDITEPGKVARHDREGCYARNV